MLLAFILHNIARYVLCQRIYRLLHISLFYILALSTVVVRMGYVATVIVDPHMFSPFDSYKVGSTFSLLQFLFFFQ